MPVGPTMFTTTSAEISALMVRHLASAKDRAYSGHTTVLKEIIRDMCLRNKVQFSRYYLLHMRK